MYIPDANIYGTNRIPEKKIVIFSGAGLDAPSGIQTFRGTDGLWNDHKIEDICDERTWKRNFELVHDFYNQRRNDLTKVKPNKAHYVIKEIIEKYGKDNVYNITQNVSDLFERINVESCQLHGNLKQMKCTACDEIWDIEYKKFDINKDRCPKCNSLKGVKPNIVFFHGQAPLYKMLNRARDYLNNPKSIVVVIGTMGNVIPIEDFLRAKPCKKILCNLEESVEINDKIFDKVYYESVETAINKIQEDVNNYWEKV